MLPSRVIAAALAIAFAVPPVAAPAQTPGALRVAVSIKPLHSLVAGVMAGVSRPRLLVRGSASPHTHAPRPSDARALARAQVVFWAGPGLEGFLVRPLAALAGRARVIALAEAPGVSHPPPGGAGGKAAAGASHPWLDPANARAMVRQAALVLSAADPANADAYRRNGRRVAERIATMDADLHRLLAPVAAEAFLVYHDAFAALTHAYGLNAAGFVAPRPGRAPGARRLKETLQRIRRLHIRCIFREPQFDSRILALLARDTGARIAVLDPLGADLEPGPDLYVRLMRANGRSLAGCLGG